jgi:nitroreductase
MNSQLDFIFSRRSIRKYSDTQIPEETVKDILEAAMAAPSAVAKDPWHFIVIRNQETLESVAEALPNGKMLIDAKPGLIVCGDIEKAHDNELSYMLQDCVAAIENILLAVNRLGLGACWLGVHPRQDRVKRIQEIFKLPGNIIPISAIALGYPAEKKEARTRYNEALVHFESW